MMLLAAGDYYYLRYIFAVTFTAHFYAVPMLIPQDDAAAFTTS